MRDALIYLEREMVQVESRDAGAQNWYSIETEQLSFREIIERLG